MTSNEYYELKSEIEHQKYLMANTKKNLDDFREQLELAKEENKKIKEFFNKLVNQMVGK